MAPANNYSTIISVSPGDVVEYLVRSEPLNHVGEISNCVDACVSELRQNLRAMESFNVATETEKSMATFIDHLLEECRGLYLTVLKRVKEVGNIADVRSQDLRLAISRFHGTPLTTPPTSSPGTNPSLTQIIAKAEGTRTVQAEFLSVLEADMEKIKTALGKLSNRGKPLKLLLSAFTERTGDSSASLLVQGGPRCVDYDYLCARYHRLSQEFVTGVDTIVKNGETIRELALVLERNRGADPTIAPDPDALPTLAEELSVWRTYHPRESGTLRKNSRPVTVERVVRILYFELLNVWVGLPVRDCFDSTYPSSSPWFGVLAFLMVLSTIVVKLMHRVGNPAADNGPAELQIPTGSSQSIRDLLLGGNADISNELVHNLVPKRT